MEDLTLNSLHTTLVFQAENNLFIVPPPPPPPPRKKHLLQNIFIVPPQKKHLLQNLFIVPPQKKHLLQNLFIVPPQKEAFTTKLSVARKRKTGAQGRNGNRTHLSHTRRERRTSDNFVLRLKHQCRKKRI